MEQPQAAADPVQLPGQVPEATQPTETDAVAATSAPQSPAGLPSPGRVGTPLSSRPNSRSQSSRLVTRQEAPPQRSLRASQSESMLPVFQTRDHVYEGKVAVLVTDMSGFTRITRKRGIIHFASLILKMRTLVRPCLEQHRAMEIQPHADNYYAVFPTVADAALAANNITIALALYNSNRLEPDDKVLIGGMGIAYGTDVRTLGHEMYGRVVEEAFALGEDVAEDGAVLVTPAAHDALLQSTQFAGVRFEECESDDPHAEAGEGQQVPKIKYFIMKDSGNIKTERLRNEPLVMTTPEAQRFYQLAMQRLDRPDERETVDAEIRQAFIGRYAAMLVSNKSMEQVTEEKGLDESLRLRKIKENISFPIYQRNGGIVVEPGLVFFESEAAVFLCAVELRLALQEHNAKGVDFLPVDCIGVHIGDVLLVPGTDIHWGDPVNTASKMAEDLGRKRQVLISEALYQPLLAVDIVKEYEAANKVRFVQHKAMVSNLELTFYEVLIGAEVPAAEHTDDASAREFTLALSNSLRSLSGRKVQGSALAVAKAAAGESDSKDEVQNGSSAKEQQDPSKRGQPADEASRPTAAASTSKRIKCVML